MCQRADRDQEAGRNIDQRMRVRSGSKAKSKIDNVKLTIMVNELRTVFAFR